MNLDNISSPLPTILEKEREKKAYCACAAEGVKNPLPCPPKGKFFTLGRGELSPVQGTWLGTCSKQRHCFRMASVSNEISLEFKKKAHRWCKKYLGGSWSTVSLDEFSVEILRYVVIN